MVLPTQSKSAVASLWYCRIHGLERGPITWDMLQELARGGDLRPSDLVRRGDQTQWVVASQARHDDPPAERTPSAPVETKLTARLAAALSADALEAHAPAQVFRRVRESETVGGAPRIMDADHELTAHAALGHSPRRDAVTEIATAVRDDSIDEDGPVLTLVDEERAGTAAAPAEPHPAPLPAVAAANAIRNAKRRNPAGVALLALGLALVGVFKLALPLGLLSLYLAWRSAGDLRRRRADRGPVSGGVGLATAAAAMAVAAIDVGVSLYYIAK